MKPKSADPVTVIYDQNTAKPQFPLLLPVPVCKKRFGALTWALMITLPCPIFLPVPFGIKRNFGAILVQLLVNFGAFLVHLPWTLIRTLCCAPFSFAASGSGYHVNAISTATTRALSKILVAYSLFCSDVLQLKTECHRKSCETIDRSRKWKGLLTLRVLLES